MGTPDSGNFDSFDAEREVSKAVFFPKAFDFFATNSFGNTVVNK